MKEIKPLYLFEYKNGKWNIRLNGAYLAETYQTYGLPLEMMLKEIENWTPEEKIMAMFNSWKIKIKNGYRIHKN